MTAGKIISQKLCAFAIFITLLLVVYKLISPVLNTVNTEKRTIAFIIHI